MISTRHRSVVCRVGLMFALAALSGCARQKPVADAKPFTEYFAIGVGTKTPRMQVAVYGPEMSNGLMRRATLGADDGMLFVYPEPQGMSFWMQNVLLPLDIGFFAVSGELREIRPMYPQDESRVVSHSREIQFALEMNQGWFSRNGVKPGDRLDRAALKAALVARGFSPKDFGFE